VKFNDADLIGLPLRLTVSERGRSSKAGWNFKRRDSPDKAIVPQSQVIASVIDELRRMREEINGRVVTRGL